LTFAQSKEDVESFLVALSNPTEYADVESIYVVATLLGVTINVIQCNDDRVPLLHCTPSSLDNDDFEPVLTTTQAATPLLVAMAHAHYYSILPTPTDGRCALFQRQFDRPMVEKGEAELDPLARPSAANTTRSDARRTTSKRSATTQRATSHKRRRKRLSDSEYERMSLCCCAFD
jgi:hypothetical protein